MSRSVKSVELPTGVTLNYAEQGSTEGIPVILLHGMGDSWRSFEPVLQFLPEDILVIALSQRGHGDSSKPEKGYLYNDFASDLAAFMDALNIKKAVLVGHSMGSSNAKRFALDYPERTLGLVLIGSFTDASNDPGDQEFYDTVISKMEDPLDRDQMEELQKEVVGGKIPQQFLETIVQEALKVPARVWQAVLLRDLEEDMSAEQSKIKAPTLIMWGDQDPVSTRSAQDLQLKTIPNAKLLIYEGFGHAPHWEEPERFTSDLVKFIKKIPGSR